MTYSLRIEYGQKAESGNLKNSVMKVRMLFTNSKINIMVYLLLYHTYSSENTFKKLSAKLFWCLAEFEKMADKMSGNPTFDLENSESR